MAKARTPIRVNRAPVLTLWAAAVVAERLGHPPKTALSLASAVAGITAWAKARRLGISEEKDRKKDAAPERPQDTTQLLGRQIRLAHDADGVVLADAADGKPAVEDGLRPRPPPPGRRPAGGGGQSLAHGPLVAARAGPGPPHPQ